MTGKIPFGRDDRERLCPAEMAEEHIIPYDLLTATQ